jgi:hypothetical protein
MLRASYPLWPNSPSCADPKMTGTRCLFVANQRKTEFFSPLARRMQELGAEIFWISTSDRWTVYLKNEGWPAASILELAQSGREWTPAYVATTADRDRMERLERASGVAVKNILLMDREVASHSGVDQTAYAFVVAREVENFVRGHGIRFGFGEVTWAVEMITSQVLSANGGAYYCHSTVRIPSTRIAFFRGVWHDTVEDFRPPTEEHRRIAREAIAGISQRSERPYYFSANASPQKFQKHWWDELHRALARGREGRFDISVPPLSQRIGRRLGARSRAAAARRLLSAPRRDARDTAAPFVLVLMHKQPESSIDVAGAPFDNQLEAIRAMARTLPFDREIWVKEHSHAIGDRPPSYYRALQRTPGVRLIDPGADAFALMRKAELVVCAAGTAAMEAAVMGVPSMTFGKLFFGPILFRNGFDPYALDAEGMRRLLDEARRFRIDPAHPTRVETFMTWLVAQSGSGYVNDPANDPACLAPDNIDLIARLSLEMMTALGERRADVKGAAHALN